MRDDDLWNRAKALVGEQGLSGVIAKILRDWVQKEEARRQSGEGGEIELWVGGGMYENDHGDDGPLHIAFTGRLIAESKDLGREVHPEICVYQTRTGKLVVYSDWRGHGQTEELATYGATYLEFPNLKTLAAKPRVLNAHLTPWEGESPDLEKELLRQAAHALGEKLVMRID